MASKLSRTTTEAAAQAGTWCHPAVRLQGVHRSYARIEQQEQAHLTEELLCLVTELQEEMRGLRSIEESKRCYHTLPSLKQTPLADRTHDTEDSLSSLCLAEHSDFRDTGEWQQVPAQRSRHMSSVTAPLAQVPSHNWYKALQVELNNKEDHGSSSLEVLLRLSWSTPCIKTASIKKGRWVIVIGGSLLKGTEGSISRPDPVLREVCCHPGAWVKDV